MFKENVRRQDSNESHLRRSLRRRVLRALGVVLGMALAMEALYLIAMNVFLDSSLFATIVNATPRVVDIHYRRGWSFFPTRIRAKDLTIVAQDANVQWILKIDDVTFDCTLGELFAKRFHASHVRGSGITFFMRRTVLSPLATDAYVEYLPPIDELGPPGIRPSEGPYAGTWLDKDWHLWTVRLDNVIAEHVHEIWFDSGRFEGDARIAGGFYLKPIRDVEVGPITLDTRQGAVKWKGDWLLSPLELRASMHLEPLDPRTATDEDLLGRLSIDAEGVATVPSAGLFPSPDGVRASGVVTIDAFALRLVRGVAQEPTRIDAGAKDFEVRAKNGNLRGAAHIAIGVVRADLAGERLAGDAKLSLVGIKGTLDGDRGAPPLTVDEVELSARSDQLDLEFPSLRDFGWHLGVRGATLRDATALGALLPSHDVVAIEGGHATLRADLGTPSGERAANGTLDVAMEHGAVRLGKTRLDGDFALAATLQAFDPERLDVGLASSRLVLRDVAVSGSSADTSRWSAVLVVDDGELRLAPKPRFDGNVRLEARDATAILDLLLRDSVPAFVAHLAAMPGLTASSHVFVASDALALSDLHARGGDMTIDGVYVAKGNQRRAAFVVEKGIVSAGIDLVNGEGPHVRLFGLDDWYRGEVREAMSVVEGEERATQQ